MHYIKLQNRLVFNITAHISEAWTLKTKDCFYDLE